MVRKKGISLEARLKSQEKELKSIKLKEKKLRKSISKNKKNLRVLKKKKTPSAVIKGGKRRVVVKKGAEAKVKITSEQIIPQGKTYWRYTLSYYIFSYKGSDADKTFKAEMIFVQQQDREKVSRVLYNMMLDELSKNYKGYHGLRALFRNSNVTGDEEVQISEKEFQQSGGKLNNFDFYVE